MMGRYDAEIDKYFAGDVHSRAIAQAFAEHFEGKAFSDRLIPAMLRESAAVNARILAGEISPEAGRELIASLASENYGLPPHVISNTRTWFDQVSTELAEQGILSQDENAEPVSAEPPGPHDRLIARLFAPADRPAAAAIAKAMAANPQIANRAEALLTELARPTDMNPQQSYAFIHDFAQKIGLPPALVAGILDASSAPTEVEHDAAVLHELTGDLSPRARHLNRVAEREAAQKDVAKGFAAMRAEPGTADWKWYWKEGGAEAYRAALEVTLVEPPPTMPTAALPAAPAPEPEPAAPTAAAPVAPPVQPAGAP
jgi:hypothetical protein